MAAGQHLSESRTKLRQPNYHYGALANLGLARAYALQGETAKASAKYQEFLALWKDAAPS